MNKRTADRLTRIIPQQADFIEVTNLRPWWILRSSRNAHSWDVECLDTRTGDTFVIRSKEDWDNKRDQLLAPSYEQQ